MPRYTGLPFSWDELPSDLDMTFAPVHSSDGVDTIGIYYCAKGHTPDVGVLVVHPRGDYSRFYAAPGLARQGYGVLCFTTRYLNNDTDAQHERMLLDLAAAMRWLRAQGMERVALFGNSGGGSLTTFYQSQAQKPAEERITHTPAGDRVPLAGEDMPLAWAQLQVAVHIGEGHFMGKSIDPAVVDEDNPVLTDAALDMYDPANGRRRYPETSSYDRGWLERYEAAQRDRCARLDARCRSALGLRRLADDKGDGDGWNDRERLRRAVPYVIVYRTLANPAYLDLTIDPSDRNVGSSFTEGIDPVIGNYGMNGLGRTMTPRAWLSTWSPAASNASMVKSLPASGIPSLLVNATGDSEIPPGEFAEIVDGCHAEDKTVLTLRGNHYLRPLQESDPDPRAELDGMLAEWLGART
jgi:hypothetical protein